MKGLGRRPAPDSRDHQFLMRRRLAKAGAAAMPVSKTWAINGKSLDQGETGTCVGHAWRNFLRCAPTKTEKGGPSAFDIYRTAVAIDEFGDNDGEAGLPDFDRGLAAGTSVRAGADALLVHGRLKLNLEGSEIRGYLWAFDLQSVIEWVLTVGPVVMGANWYSSLSEPDGEGIAHIRVGATNDGGHAFLVRGINTKRSLATCENSWSDGWGKKGTFFLPLTYLERLIHEDGEACTAIEKKLLPKIVTA